MKISINKTETMKVSRTPSTLNIYNTNLKQVRVQISCQHIHRRWSNEQGNWKQDTEGQQCQLPACPTTKTSWYPNGDKEQNHKLHLCTNTHIPMPNLDHDQASGVQNYKLLNKIFEQNCQQDQKRHGSQHQNQRNGRDKEHLPSYSTSEDQMVWTSDTTANTPPYLAQRAYNTRFSGRKARGRPRKTWINESKRHYLCTTSPPPPSPPPARHSDVQQTNVSFFLWCPKWYKQQTKVK